MLAIRAWNWPQICTKLVNYRFFSFLVQLFFFFFFLREKRNIHVSETSIVSSCMCSDWGLNLQPRLVPWPRKEPVTFWFAGPRPAKPQGPGLHPLYFKYKCWTAPITSLLCPVMGLGCWRKKLWIVYLFTNVECLLLNHTTIANILQDWA